MNLKKLGNDSKPSLRFKKSPPNTPEVEPKNPIDSVKNSILIWLNRRLGFRLTTALSILAIAAWTTYTNWDDIQKTAPYRWLRAAIEDRLPAPQASSDKFTILILQLENDAGDRRRRLITEALMLHFEKDEVQLLLPNRRIYCCDDENPQNSLQEAKARAESLLTKSRADAIIWGSATDDKLEGPIRLHWTSKSKPSHQTLGKYTPSTGNYDLPPLFWNDLEKVVHLIASTEMDTTLKGLSKGYFAPELAPIIAKTKRLLDGNTLSKESALPIRKALAFAQRLHGSQTQDHDEMAQSILNYIEIVSTEEKIGKKADIASSYHELGDALLAFGNVESAEALKPLDMAERSFRRALSLTSRKDDPFRWSLINSKLADTQTIQGRIRQDAQLLRIATSAHEDSIRQLRELGENKTADLLTINLGTTLAAYSKLTNSDIHFKRAIDLQRHSIAALADNKWLKAAAEDNLARTLLLSDSPQSIDLQRLNDAMQLLDAAAGEFTQERVPMKWASMQIDRCNALWILGERQSDVAVLLNASSACNAALSVFTPSDNKDSFAGAHKVLGNVLGAIGVLKNDAGYIQAAVTSYSLAATAYAELGDMNGVLQTKLNQQITEKEFKQKISAMAGRRSGPPASAPSAQDRVASPSQ